MLKSHPTGKLRICIRHGIQPVPRSEDLCTAACFMFLKHVAVSDSVHIHVANHWFILLRAIWFFLVERFQVLLIPYLISHRKQFITHSDLNLSDSCGVGNLSCLSLIFGKCFNGISKLCYYEVLTETRHLFFFFFLQ